jgi:3-oxoacyl-[acyl-carrier-protein] synthase-3
VTATRAAASATGLRFAGIGSALPANSVTNVDLSANMETSDEWIRERTGIGERRLGSTTSELAIAAARLALAQSGVDAADIGQVILATTTPDYIMPGTAPVVAYELGIECGAFDVQAVCSGWVYGMVIANGFLHQGVDNVLLIGADTMERITDYGDRGTGILFGNGAGAAVLQRNDPERGALLGWDLGSNGDHVHILYREHGKTMSMDGKEVFRQAVTVMQRSAHAALDMAGLEVSDIDFVIPHQANVRIVEAAWKRLGDSPARQEFTRRVLDGESAVWVVVSGTDATANADFLTRLKKRLTFLETAAQLPFIDPNDPDSQLGPGPEVKLKFSILEINRQDPLEEVTVAMLAGTKGTKSFPTEQPFAALAFGRGRVLGAWPATDLQDAQIEESTLFLTKACSCQAKALNPGWDLLMTVNWDDALRAAEDQRPKSTAASSKPTPPEVVQIVPTNSAPVDALPSKRNHSKLLASIAVGLLFVVLGAKLIGRRS